MVCLYISDNTVNGKNLQTLKSIFYVFHIDFYLLILANCVRDESCREKLAPTSPNGSKIQDVAGNSVHSLSILGKAQII